MSDADMRRFLVEYEVRSAEEKAAENLADVERISREHLANLAHLPRTERAKRVDDPELTLADRQALVASLASNVAERRGRLPQPRSSRMDSLRRLWGRNRHRAPGLIQALVLFGPICAVALMAYSNTGQRVPGLPGSELEFRNPNGSVNTKIIGRDEKLVAIRHFGQWYVRTWKIRDGYALAPVKMN